VYESRKQPLLPEALFRRRLALHLAIAATVVAGSLGIGMAGYAAFEHLSWLDAFLNAAMLLGGMGPVNMPQTAAGKLFAGVYALYSGFVVLVVAATLFAPVLHRILHRFHLESKKGSE
jgi:ABC-type dipeptide/oligopeptide/nickel transport system permease component